jgi:signal transduction histidine kinase
MYILGRILPQILFSITLTTLVVVSYYFMYRSLRINQRLMDLKNDFINNITHELKTPVATISVALEALQNFDVLKDPEKTLQYLEIASMELNRLNLMTDKILNTSIFEHKGVEFQAEPVDLREMIRQVAASMKLVSDKRNAKITFEEEGEDFRVSGSPVHLINVIYNLVDNALKYSEPGVTILIRMKSDGRHVEFTVQDNGPGIPPEYHQKIFEKFSRVPGGDIHDSKGYGLGLHYVKQVVGSHHGTISLVSRPGAGSSFTVRIPKSHA